jgi:hypothetical protein
MLIGLMTVTKETILKPMFVDVNSLIVLLDRKKMQQINATDKTELAQNRIHKNFFLFT